MVADRSAERKTKVTREREKSAHSDLLIVVGAENRSYTLKSRHRAGPGQMTIFASVARVSSRMKRASNRVNCVECMTRWRCD